MIKKILLLILFFGSYSKLFCQQWNDVGGGGDRIIQCMYVDSSNNLLIVGGQFDTVGNISAHKIAVWDGNNWNAVGSNSDFLGNAESINTIIIFNNEIIVGGLFDSVGNVAAKNIARWNGSQWSPMADGLDDIVLTLESYHGELYAGGGFIYSGIDTMNYIAKWNGSNWIKVNNGFNNYVSSLLRFNDTLIVGGAFSANYEVTLPGSSVYGYDGNNWITLGSGLPPSIAKNRIINDTLYSVGNFSNNLTGMHYISKWDGQDWLIHPYPGGGAQPWITDIAFYFDQIFVCGFFTTPPDVAIFNGTSYDSIANVYGYVNNMEVYKNELYVAVSFSSLNNLNFRNITRYNLADAIQEIGISEIAMSIYPNPYVQDKGELKINFHSSIRPPIMIMLYNLSGEIIQQNLLNNRDTAIEISNKVTSGIYFINCIDQEGRSVTGKILISK